MKKRIAIIPARGGSKGIPNKNITLINGQPLIYYTIKPAMELKREGMLDCVLVSTDSVQIADISLALGAEVPFLRPEHLADDKSKSIDLMLHALEYYKSISLEFDYSILLQPTSPLRKKEDIVNSINIFDSYKSDSLISCCIEEHKYAYKKDGFYGEPCEPEHNLGMRRQDYIDLYVRNGAIYISDINYLINEHKIISDKPLIYEMPRERSIDINTSEDLKIVRYLISESE